LFDTVNQMASELSAPADTTVVLVHGIPETAEIWDPLRDVLPRPTTALALPGFGCSRPNGFSATKDAYAEWLAASLQTLPSPVDVVAHDLGALLTMRVVSAFDVPVRSWVVDVPAIFHPRFAWPPRVRQLQTPGVGETLLRTMREADAADPHSTASRLAAGGVPAELARLIGAHHDQAMSSSILDFYRSAAPNLAADWWQDAAGARRSRGLVLLLPDPPAVEAMAIEVAETMGAATARLDRLEHCWMAEAPERVAEALDEFWATLEPSESMT
jgi:pimeloyl-ACP methyl ester carboxylesterase